MTTDLPMHSMRILLFLMVCVAVNAGDPIGNSLVAKVDSGRLPVLGRPPTPRSPAQIVAAMAAVPASPAAEIQTPPRVLLIAGPKDHGPGTHDYPAWREAMTRLLKQDPQVTVQGGDDLPTAEAFAQADVAVLFRMGAWSVQLEPAVAAFQERGGGLVLLHSAVATSAATMAAITRRIGLSWSAGQPAHTVGKACCGFKGGAYRLSVADADHPVIRGLRGSEFELNDETYSRLHGDTAGITVLATGNTPDGNEPMLWTREDGRGRVVVDLLGHNNFIHNDPLHRLLLLRAIAWSAHRPVDRLHGLVLADADVGK